MPATLHARTHATADYRDLTATQQDRFDHLMEQADNAGPADYPILMTALTTLVGLPRGAEIRKCGCSCICDTVFDANADDVHVIEDGDGYNLGRVQCPWCADQHPETA